MSAWFPVLRKAEVVESTLQAIGCALRKVGSALRQASCPSEAFVGDDNRQAIKVPSCRAPEVDSLQTSVPNHAHTKTTRSGSELVVEFSTVRQHSLSWAFPLTRYALTLGRDFALTRSERPGGARKLHFQLLFA